jgi:uncharacterized protein
MVDVADVLRRARTIAVLGAHHEPSKPAFYVPDYLHEQGYRILPVNPLFAGRVLWGEPVRSRLDELGLRVDIVDVFRRSDALPPHLPEILAMAPRPALVWLQLGIVNDAFARDLEAEGIEVVQDRCTLADHRRLGIGKIA